MSNGEIKVEEHHKVNWYNDEVTRFAGIAASKFGVELNDREKKSIRDEMYRAVNSAKVREVTTKN